MVSSKEWLQRFPSAKSLARSSTLNPKRLGFTYESVRTVERAYDENLPFQIRLETLGNIISKTSILPTIEREILVWAATIRWLVRSQSFELANLTLKEFQAINLRLSEGKNVDVLGSFADMKNRSWLRIPTPPVQKINSTKAVA